MSWQPNSWRARQISQQPNYSPDAPLDEVEARLRHLPPIVIQAEIVCLRQAIAEAQCRRAFVLQAGDCAESLRQAPASVTDLCVLLGNMAGLLTDKIGLPVTKIARAAGQFAKPRCSPIEERDGLKLDSYRGDIVNGHAFTPAARRADPWRQLQAYRHARDVLRSMHQDVYSSHEALLLGYEQALTRADARTGRWYDTSAHFVWLGDRTRQLDGAHVEFARGIANPIGIKAGPSLEADTLLRLIDRLNPKNLPGRLTIISRMGWRLVHEKLGALVRAVAREGRRVLWVCDPMHGNTFMGNNGYKMRLLAHMIGETAGFVDVHHSEGTWAGGIHLELSADDVTECIDSESESTSIPKNYRSLCDPRLNPIQGLEIVLRMSDMLAAPARFESAGCRRAPTATRFEGLLVRS